MNFDTMVNHIVNTYDAATETQCNDGAEWYPAMFRVMREHSKRNGFTVAQCAAVYAANSINTPWARNVALAAQALQDGGMTGGTLGMIVDKVNRILNGEHIDTTLTSDPSNRKIVNFRRNLSGDYESVTVDRWAYRIATGWADCKNRGTSPCKANGRHGCGKVPTGAEYESIATAYRGAAMMRNVDPATMQAVTWCVVRGDGE